MIRILLTHFSVFDGNLDMQSLLRTHTSSVQIRYMEKNKPPFAIVCPGRVYRRDSVDATHSALFHQVEIMAIGKDFNLGNLRATIIHFLKCMFGDDIEVHIFKCPQQSLPF